VEYSGGFDTGKGDFLHNIDNLTGKGRFVQGGAGVWHVQ
jgi:hypothetical protein